MGVYSNQYQSYLLTLNTPSMFFQRVVILAIIGTAFAAEKTAKRGIFDTGFDGGFAAPFQNYVLPPPPIHYQPYSHSVSPAEIASAIQAAKEASSSVMSAQHRVQEAKEAVLHQQHLASQKQAQAALALQKTEAAAAVQQQEAKAAATSLVQAQQRLAHAKAEVAEQQRIAAAKEAHAAAVIHKSAHAAAVEIQKTDDAARKISALQHSGASTLRQVVAAKQASLSATSAAVAASAGHPGGNPWFGQRFIHLQPWG